MPSMSLLKPVSANLLAMNSILSCAAPCTDWIFSCEFPDTYRVSLIPCAAFVIPVACSLCC